MTSSERTKTANKGDQNAILLQSLADLSNRFKGLWLETETIFAPYNERIMEDTYCTITNQFLKDLTQTLQNLEQTTLTFRTLPKLKHTLNPINLKNTTDQELYHRINNFFLELSSQAGVPKPTETNPTNQQWLDFRMVDLSNKEALESIDRKIDFGILRFSTIQRFVIANQYTQNIRATTDRTNKDTLTYLHKKYQILKHALQIELDIIDKNTPQPYEDEIHMKRIKPIKFGILPESQTSILDLLYKLHITTADILYYDPKEVNTVHDLQQFVGALFVIHSTLPTQKDIQQGVRHHIFPFKLKEGVIESYFLNTALNKTVLPTPSKRTLDKITAEYFAKEHLLLKAYSNLVNDLRETLQQTPSNEELTKHVETLLDKNTSFAQTLRIYF